MAHIKAVIVDDEPGARNVLSHLLDLGHPEVQIVASCENLIDAVPKIKGLQPDVVFLDVEMPEYSGYEIARFFDEIEFQIVFITAYDKYAIKAFEINAVDYILKPIEWPRLAAAIEKISLSLKQQQNLKRYHEMLQTLENQKSPSLILTESGKKQVIKLTDIIAFCAKGAYSEVYVKEDKPIVVSKNIGTFE